MAASDHLQAVQYQWGRSRAADIAQIKANRARQDTPAGRYAQSQIRKKRATSIPDFEAAWERSPKSREVEEAERTGNPYW